MQILHTDFMVASAGIAGMCAAISAARHGLKVVLVNDRSGLGGSYPPICLYAAPGIYALRLKFIPQLDIPMN